MSEGLCSYPKQDHLSDQARLLRVCLKQISKKLPRMETAQPFWNNMTGSRAKYFPYIQMRCPLFKLMVTVSSSCHAPWWWGYSIFSSARWAAVRFPQIQLFSGLIKLQLIPPLSGSSQLNMLYIKNFFPL